MPGIVPVMTNHTTARNTDPKPSHYDAIIDIYDWYATDYALRFPQWSEGEVHVAAENAASRYAY
jgi:hypothetical protein